MSEQQPQITADAEQTKSERGSFKKKIYAGMALISAAVIGFAGGRMITSENTNPSENPSLRYNRFGFEIRSFANEILRCDTFTGQITVTTNIGEGIVILSNNRKTNLDQVEKLQHIYSSWFTQAYIVESHYGTYIAALDNRKCSLNN